MKTVDSIVQLSRYKCKQKCVQLVISVRLHTCKIVEFYLFIYLFE